MPRSPIRIALTSLALCAILSGCPGPGPAAEVPILDPEPASAPTEIADGFLACLGNNAPMPATVTDLLLPGYTRALADPGNALGVQPAATLEAFDATGSRGTAVATPLDGRVVLSVSVGPAGFDGWVRATADGLVPTSLYSSRAYTRNIVSGWVWMPTPAEMTDQATTAGVTLTPGQGTLVGAVHDCDVFGIANAVIRYGDRIDGVVYYEGFAPDPALTFTGASGRFAVANLAPGPITVEAFGRLEASGPLVLLSRAEVTIVADEITSVDLQPRVDVER